MSLPIGALQLPLPSNSGALNGAPAASSVDVTLPLGPEYFLVSGSAQMAFRVGVGAQTAVATDIQFGGASGSILIRVNPSPQNAYHLAVFGTGTFNVTPVTPC